MGIMVLGSLERRYCFAPTRILKSGLSTCAAAPVIGIDGPRSGSRNDGISALRSANTSSFETSATWGVGFLPVQTSTYLAQPAIGAADPTFQSALVNSSCNSPASGPASAVVDGGVTMFTRIPAKDFIFATKSCCLSGVSSVARWPPPSLSVRLLPSLQPSLHLPSFYPAPLYRLGGVPWQHSLGYERNC